MGCEAGKAEEQPTILTKKPGGIASAGPFRETGEASSASRYRPDWIPAALE
jgi:hypothetical protein